MGKPNLLSIIEEIIGSNEPPNGFKPTTQDIIKIVELCEIFQFYSSNRTDFAQQIEQIIEEILGRDAS